MSTVVAFRFPSKKSKEALQQVESVHSVHSFINFTIMKPALSAASVARRNGILKGKSYYRRNQNNVSSCQLVVQNYHSCTVNNSRRDDEKQKENHLQNHAQLIGFNNKYQVRNYVSATEPKSKSAPVLIMGLGSIALAAKAGQYGVQAYQQWKESQPPPEENKSEESSKMHSEEKEEREKREKSTAQDNTNKGEEKRENIFAKLFGSVGTKYYEGGFDDKMTAREAALILGVRQSSTAKRIKDAHRKLLVLNHPDTGGSTYLAGKLNEAKELLLKGRKS